MSQAAVVAQQRLGPHHHDMQPGDDHLRVQAAAAAAAAAVEGHIHQHQPADEELAARVAARLAAVVEAHGQGHHLSHNAAAMEAAAAAAAELLEGELEFELSSSSCAMQSEDSEGPSCYWLDGTEEDNAGEESDCDMEKPPVEEFSLCELDAADTRAIEVQEEGKDLQGIPWTRLQFERNTYRKQRLSLYKTYTNLIPEDGCTQARQELTAGYPQPTPDGSFYTFLRNWREVNSTIVHFQLRNLLWAGSAHEVYVVADNMVQHWHCACRQTTTLLDLRGAPRGPHLPGLGRVQVSTLCVSDDLVAAGGFTGELVVGRLGAAGPVHSCRVTQSENGITNGIEINKSSYLGHGVMTSNNDCFVRWFDVETWRPCYRLPFDWPVNYASLRPPSADPMGGPVVAVVGDDPVTAVMDLRNNKRVASLVGHQDYSFAVAWHPQGWLLATGNQDTTTLVWDMRYTSKPLAVLGGTMGAIRSLRFSPDGRYLAASEPADFVHIYDVAGGLQQVQEIDLFGEIAGISFSPDGQGFFVGVSDVAYNSLVQYQLRPQGGLDPWGCEPWTQDPLHQPQQPQQQQQQQATAAAGERRWQQRRGDAAAAAEQEEDPHEME